MAFTFTGSNPPYSYLSATVKGSFAYRTVKDRMPIILTKVIDFLCRNKKVLKTSCNMEQPIEELKVVIGKLSKLRSEMQTNKPLLPLEFTSSHLDDGQKWNKHFTENVTHQWFNSPWLLVECYMYRAIYAAFEDSIHLKEIDPFGHLKEEAFFAQESIMCQLAAYTNSISFKLPPNEMHIHFIKLLKICLWGNRNDLSISAGKPETKLSSICDDIEELNSHILVNDGQQVWLHVEQLKSASDNKELRIILDNCGLEMITDLCLAIYCISQKLFNRVYFYIKKIPWFVSDVTLKDFHWVLQQMKNNEKTGNTDLPQLAEKCLSYLSSGQFQIIEESFWTLPLPYYVMKDEDPKLYENLSHSQLIIFKGDLNYRKLGGDINWPSNTTFHTFLQGFHPAPLVALRTIKAEIVCELPFHKVEELEKTDIDWMTKGDYGLIQFTK